MNTSMLGLSILLCKFFLNLLTTSAYFFLLYNTYLRQRASKVFVKQGKGNDHREMVISELHNLLDKSHEIVIIVI